MSRPPNGCCYDQNPSLGEGHGKNRVARVKWTESKKRISIDEGNMGTIEEKKKSIEVGRTSRGKVKVTKRG